MVFSSSRPVRHFQQFAGSPRRYVFILGSHGSNELPPYLVMGGLTTSVCLCIAALVSVTKNLVTLQKLLWNADHIPVKADFSDLAQVIAWCKRHDAECQRIADNAKALYERLVSIDGQLDYLQLMMCEIARRYVPPPKMAEAWSTEAGVTLQHEDERTSVHLTRQLGRGDWFDLSTRHYASTPVDSLASTLPNLAEWANPDVDSARNRKLRVEIDQRRRREELKRRQESSMTGIAQKVRRREQQTRQKIASRLKSVDFSKYKPKS